MNFFFRSKNFIRFIKNKKNSNQINNLKINNLKSRCLDKIEKRSYINLFSSSVHIDSLAKSLGLLTSNGQQMTCTSTTKLSGLDVNDLKFILNEELIIENK